MNYTGKEGMANAFATMFDAMDPKYEEVKRINEKGRIPRYHLNDDGESPRVVDIYEEYPNQQFKLIYERGYIYLGNTNGEKLFMSMHCMSDKKEDVEKVEKYLIRVRQKDYESEDHPLHNLWKAGLYRRA